MQMHLAALPPDLIDLAFAVFLAAGFDRKQLRVPRERGKSCQQISCFRTLLVAKRALLVMRETPFLQGALHERRSSTCGRLMTAM